MNRMERHKDIERLEEIHAEITNLTNEAKKIRSILTGIRFTYIDYEVPWYENGGAALPSGD